LTKKKKIQKPDVYEIPTGQDGADSFTIVGIGASAGALKACQGFFTGMPPDSGAAFVIVIHLDPSHSSIFVSLLQKYTQIQVFEAENGMVVEPNRVYVIPPRADISIQQGRLQLQGLSGQRGAHMAIDFFFRSLAEDQGERAACIILSGTGTDGTSGLRAVKAGLGMVMVQDPATAEYDGMPRSALDTGLADYVLPVEEMPAQLLAYMNGSRQMKNGGAPAVEDSGRDSFSEALEILRVRTGHDFSLYKKGTIFRRIERRMNVNQIAGITEYISFLQDNPEETQVLFRELLINVTSFFRDPEVFAIMKEQALPQLLAGKPENYPVRVWVPGCATGEEVYSLAIVLRECLDALQRSFNVQIFGTDMDDEAIATARRGVYPLNISADVSPERLNGFFITENETYKIRKEIRDAAVFATHDVAKDPPFARLDLICCRNLLIYLETPLQRRLLALFHHLLQPDGILLLGTAETLGELEGYFTVINKKGRIFRRLASPGLPPATEVYPIISISSSLTNGQRAASFNTPELGRPTISQVLEKELLEKYAPPSVVINSEAEIVYVHGRTGKYLEMAPGQPPWSILDMAREGLRYELKSAIQQATAGQTEIVREGVLVVSDSNAEFIKLTVRPIIGSRSLEGLLLVMFEGQEPLVSQAKDETAQPASATDEHTALLEQKLSQTRQLLQATVKDMEASYQEVASSNEELLSTNEELQSSNEELETSKEEMQSLYEELMAVNSELRNKIDELSRSNSDLHNFLNSTEIAALFLDNELKIRRFTPLATQIFNLLPVDVGRPLEHIVSNLMGESVIEDAREVLSTLVLFNKELQTKQGAWYLMKILPYRAENNAIEGVVITFTDINEPKKALAQTISVNKELESFCYSISHDLRAPLRTINGFSQMIADQYQDKLDDDGKNLLQIVRFECNRMGLMISDLLALSRQSRKDLKREEVDLSAIAETIADELHKLEPERMVEFIISPGIQANGDRELLRSVLQNLLDNSWKFTGKHPQARIEFGVADRDGEKTYFVRDDGAGFDMKYIDKLFGTFQRIHAMDEFPGNGIGLAISQRIIHHHGGQVWAEGEVEKGATFYFTLG
jgi:two-component system CheB/CheR fusion protein